MILDEIPQADWCAEFSVADTHRLITDCFAVDAEAASLGGQPLCPRGAEGSCRTGADGAEQELRSGVGHFPAVRQSADLAALVEHTCWTTSTPI